MMDKKYRISAIVLFTFLFGQLGTYAQGIEQQIDQLLTEKYADNQTGAVYFISKGGEQIFKKAYGFSNLEVKTPMKTDNVFEIGSITKQFTAIAIMLLEEEGKLKTEDKISTYISDYPNGEQISIHHLLTHTSGIKDFTRVKGLAEIATKELS